MGKLVDLKPLNYTFINKPLLIGGGAKEFHGVRKSGKDIDLVVSQEDHNALSKLYPDNIKDLFGDIGVHTGNFEIWNQICGYDYNYLKDGAIETDDLLIVSLPMLRFMTKLAIRKEKYAKDLELIDAKLKEKE